MSLKPHPRPASTASLPGPDREKEPATTRDASPTPTLHTAPSPRPSPWLAWIASVRIGSGILRDVKARAPWYVSDWSDAWNYRVVPATALIFFAK